MTSLIRRPIARTLRLELPAIALCLVFSVTVLSSASMTLLQSNFIDPLVYAAYINDYVGTYIRFGQTYYSSRIAFIFVDGAFINVFGQTAGPLLCRIVFFSAAAIASFQIARRYFNFATGVLTIAWLCFIPWLLRSVSWMYADGFATVYTIVGLAFLLVPIQRRRLGHLAAGLAFALAINCNLHLLIIIGAFVPSWFVLNRKEDARSKLSLIGSAAAGLFLGYAILQLLFSLQIGTFSVFLEAAALGTAGSLLKGGAAAWFEPLPQIIAKGILIFLIPLIFVVAGTYAFLMNFKILQEEQRDLGIASILYATTLLIVSFVFHYVFKHGLISLFFYEIYFLPSCLFMLITVAGIVSIKFPHRILPVSFAISIALLALWFARENLETQLPGNGWVWFWGWIALCGTALIASLANSRALSGPAVLTVFFLTTYGIIQWQPGVASQYALWPGRTAAGEAERNAYAGAVFLQKFVNSHVSPDASIGFWYGDKPDDFTLNAVQSIFLWGYTRLHAYKGHAMPEVDPFFREQVKKKNYIALLARTEIEIDAGLKALETVPMEYDEIERARFPGGVESYYVAIAKLRPPSTVSK